MSDFNDKRRWQALCEQIPAVIKILDDLAKSPPRYRWKEHIRAVTQEVELKLAAFGDIVSVYWPQSWDCQSFYGALGGMPHAENTRELKQRVGTVVHKLRLLQVRLEAAGDFVQSGQENAASQNLAAVKDRFTFNPGQALFDGEDLGLPTGFAVEALKILHNRFGQTVSYGELDGGLSKNAAEEPLRNAVRKLRGALETTHVPCEIVTKTREGYCLCRKAPVTEKPRKQAAVKNHK